MEIMSVPMQNTIGTAWMETASRSFHTPESDSSRPAVRLSVTGESKTTPTHLLPSPQTDCGLTAPGLPRSFSRTPGPSSRSVSSVCRSWTPSPRCWSLSLSCMTWRHCTHCTAPGSLSEAGQPPPHSQCCPRPLCPAEGRTLPFISTECLV